ncbi:MAG: NYN domain-containing protein [Verrucomicrobiota bacterium]
MEESRPSFLLVDGSNILHAWPELSRLRLKNPAAARDELVKRLEEFQDWSDYRVVAVFDGRGEVTQQDREGRGIQVFYTSDSKTADDVIEQLAVKYASKFEITVATNDRAEQDMVVSTGGHAISAEQLGDWLARAKAARGEWLERHRKRD